MKGEASLPTLASPHPQHALPLQTPARCRREDGRAEPVVGSPTASIRVTWEPCEVAVGVKEQGWGALQHSLRTPFSLRDSHS